MDLTINYRKPKKTVYFNGSAIKKGGGLRPLWHCHKQKKLFFSFPNLGHDVGLFTAVEVPVGHRGDAGPRPVLPGPHSRGPAQCTILHDTYILNIRWLGQTFQARIAGDLCSHQVRMTWVYDVYVFAQNMIFLPPPSFSKMISFPPYTVKISSFSTFLKLLLNESIYFFPNHKNPVFLYFFCGEKLSLYVWYIYPSKHIFLALVTYTHENANLWRPLIFGKIELETVFWPNSGSRALYPER